MDAQTHLGEVVQGPDIQWSNWQPDPLKCPWELLTGAHLVTRLERQEEVPSRAPGHTAERALLPAGAVNPATCTHPTYPLPSLDIGQKACWGWGWGQ